MKLTNIIAIPFYFQDFFAAKGIWLQVDHFHREPL